MYSTWFHQIRELAGRDPGLLESLTPEAFHLPGARTFKKEGHGYDEPYIDIRCILKPSGPERF